LGGIEWLIEAFGCSETVLQDKGKLASLFHAIVSEMQLKPIGSPVWHQFPETGGVTGVWLLQEYHLAIHTFPEFQSACLNLFCCSNRPSLDWKARLPQLLGASEIQVRDYQRFYNREKMARTE